MDKIALTIPGMNGTPIDSGLPIGVPTGGLGTSGSNIILTLINMFLVVATLFALYQAIVGGMAIITSRGSKEGLKKSWEKVLFAFIGLIFIFFSFAAINILSSFVGIPLLPFLHK